MDDDEMIDTSLYLEEIQRLITQTAKNNFDEYFAKVIPKAQFSESRKVYNYAYVSKFPLDIKEKNPNKEIPSKVRRKGNPQKICEKGNFTEEITVEKMKDKASLKELKNQFISFISIANQNIKKKENLSKNNLDKINVNEGKNTEKSNNFVSPNISSPKSNKCVINETSNSNNKKNIIFDNYKNSFKSAKKSVPLPNKVVEPEVFDSVRINNPANPQRINKDNSRQFKTLNNPINYVNNNINRENIEIKHKKVNDSNQSLNKSINGSGENDTKICRKSANKHAANNNNSTFKSVPNSRSKIIEDEEVEEDYTNSNSRNNLNKSSIIQKNYNDNYINDDDCSLIPTNRKTKDQTNELNKSVHNQPPIRFSDENRNDSINRNNSKSNTYPDNNPPIQDKSSYINKNHSFNDLNESDRKNNSNNNFKNQEDVHSNPKEQNMNPNKDKIGGDLEAFLKQNFKHSNKPLNQNNDFDLDSFLSNFSKKTVQNKCINPSRFVEMQSSYSDKDKISNNNNFPSVNNFPNNFSSSSSNLQSEKHIISNQEKIININNNINISNFIIREEKPLTQCLNCQWLFPPNFTTSEMNAHIDRCFEGKGEIDKENYLSSIKEINILESTDKELKNDSSVDNFLCFNCSKYRNSNIIILQKHINNCLDGKVSEEKYTGKKRNADRTELFNPEEQGNSNTFFKKKFN